MTSSAASFTADETKDWLRALFSDLETKDARYVALRADRDLFRCGREMDFLVHPSSFETFLKCIQSVADEFNLYIIQWIEFRDHAANVIVVWESDGDWSHYSLDIRTGIHKHGHLVLDSRQVTSRMVIWDGALELRRLHDDLECALLAIRNAIDRRDLKPRHRRIFEERGTNNNVSAVARSLGWSVTGSLESGWEASVRRAPSSAIPRAVFTLVYGMRAIRGRFMRRAFGMNIVLYGPDGVGKSTQAMLLSNFFQQVGIRRVHLYHHLVEVNRLAERVATRTNVAKAQAYRSAPSGLLTRSIILASYMKKLSYVYTHVRSRLKRGHVFVHDRYLLDVFQKMQRARNVRSFLLERTLPRLAPGESFVFVLKTSPETVAKRSSELTLNEVNQAYELIATVLRAGARRTKTWTDIDAGESVQAVHAAILGHTLRIQHERISTRRF